MNRSQSEGGGKGGGSERGVNTGDGRRTVPPTTLMTTGRTFTWCTRSPMTLGPNGLELETELMVGTSGTLPAVSTVGPDGSGSTPMWSTTPTTTAKNSTTTDSASRATAVEEDGGTPPEEGY